MALLVPSLLYAQVTKECFKARIQTPVKEVMHVHLTSSDTIPLKHLGPIYALSIDATIEQPREASFVRIVLEDAEGHNYLVAESDWFRNDTTTVQLSEYCEETAQLNGITPLRLKCYLTNASLQLTGIHTSSEMPKRGMMMKAELESVKTAQVQNVVDRINEYNIRHGKLWRAGTNTIALLNLDEKAKSLGVNLDFNTECIEYYVGGIYEFGNSINYNYQSVNSSYTYSYDWCDKHNKNWTTPVRDQLSTPYCSAFAVAAGVEMMRNLYFNHPDTNYLSVQELACCAKFNPDPQNGSRSINVDSALTFSRELGLMPDSIYPFDENGLQICTADEKNPNDIIKISNFIYRERSSVDSLLKKDLINYGPQVCWINAMNSFNHAMLLVGYGQIQEGMKLNLYEHFSGHEEITIQAGDPRIGKTYWKFKNSWGLSTDNGYMNSVYDGYMYLLLNDPTIIYRHYSILTPITSENLNETDIVCEDIDGDGLFNWGIGPKPAHCPKWAKEESDGNDADWTKGHMNQYGFCEELPNTQPLYQYISCDSILSSPENRSKHLGVLGGATVTLQAQQTFSNGRKLLLDNGTTLILDGVTLDGSILQPYSGCKIIMNNGARIVRPFNLPLGVELVINNGSIE